MLPQFGFTELIFVAIVALIVVGPKDLPVMMRKLGQMIAKARSMANEFRAAFDDIARQTELEELRGEIEDLKRENMMASAADELKAVEADINSAVMRETPNTETPEPDEAAAAPSEKPKADPA